MKDSQSSLANDQGNGERRYHAVGLLYIQVFGSRVEAGSTDMARKLAEAIRDVFRGNSVSGAIWFRDQKVVKLPETEENYPYNVVVTFEYDTIK